jgi:hypothetical protein
MRVACTISEISNISSTSEEISSQDHGGAESFGNLTVSKYDEHDVSLSHIQLGNDNSRQRISHHFNTVRMKMEQASHEQQGEAMKGSRRRKKNTTGGITMHAYLKCSVFVGAQLCFKGAQCLCEPAIHQILLHSLVHSHAATRHASV